MARPAGQPVVVGGERRRRVPPPAPTPPGTPEPSPLSLHAWDPRGAQKRASRGSTLLPGGEERGCPPPRPRTHLSALPKGMDFPLGRGIPKPLLLLGFRPSGRCHPGEHSQPWRLPGVLRGGGGGRRSSRGHGQVCKRSSECHCSQTLYQAYRALLKTLRPPHGSQWCLTDALK